MSYQDLTNQFRAKWGREPRFVHIEGYLKSRYIAIDRRFEETFRYVELSPSNKQTFSYEFSSILRDTGSVFDSAMRELLTLVKYPMQRSEYNITDYRKFLTEHVQGQAFYSKSGLEAAVVGINSSWAQGRFLMPFATLKDEHGSFEWWTAYNDVKHADLEKVAQGNLGNCINCLGALATLVWLCWMGGGWTRVFNRIGFHQPMDEVRGALF